MIKHQIPPRAMCQVNIRKGGGLRHTMSMNERECAMCREPLYTDPVSGYWVQWVIQEQP